MKYFSALLILFLSLPAVYIFSVKTEITIDKFSSSDDIKQWIDSGWGPKWFPRDARDIVESHDVDSNSVWVAATISQKSIAKFCSTISRDEMLLPSEKYLGRLPKVIKTRFISLINVYDEVYLARCEEGFFMAIGQSGEALVWNLGDIR